MPAAAAMATSGAAITAAVSWIADQLPVFALNLILATPDDVWALRYPDTHELYVLDRAESPRQLEVSSKRIRTRSDELSGAPAVIIASEPMDGEKVGGCWIPANCCTSGRTWRSPAATRCRRRRDTS